MSYSDYIGTQSHFSKYNNLLQKYASQVNKKEIRLDVTEWIESSDRDDSSSCFILIVVQRPGAHEPQTLPQEYKSLASACVECPRLLTEVISEYGGRYISTEIRNDRLYVTTDNNVKITMVLY